MVLPISPPFVSTSTLYITDLQESVRELPCLFLSAGPCKVVGYLPMHAFKDALSFDVSPLASPLGPSSCLNATACSAKVSRVD
jgi:hypothetical protein